MLTWSRACLSAGATRELRRLGLLRLLADLVAHASGGSVTTLRGVAECLSRCASVVRAESPRMGGRVSYDGEVSTSCTTVV